jgi:hypothetical protein
MLTWRIRSGQQGRGAKSGNDGENRFQGAQHNRALIRSVNGK